MHLLAQLCSEYEVQEVILGSPDGLGWRIGLLKPRQGCSQQQELKCFIWPCFYVANFSPTTPQWVIFPLFSLLLFMRYGTCGHESRLNVTAALLLRVTAWTQTKQEQEWGRHRHLDFWKSPQVNLCTIGFRSRAAEAQPRPGSAQGEDYNLHLCHVNFLLSLASAGDGLNPGVAMKRDFQTAWMWPLERCGAKELPIEQPSTLGCD